MHSDQAPYRRLYDDMLEYEGDALGDDVLRPWLADADGERRWLDALRTRRGSPVPMMEPEELWRLYAISRIVDLLQLSFAPPVADPPWRVAAVSVDEHRAFMAGLGLEPADRAGFHPFHHEIVAVEQASDDDAPPEVVGTCWPGYALGPLLVTRAGCVVRAGRRHLAKEVAERSTLYWAFARNHRPAEDLSRGWGGSSQWRTAFRRDYAVDGRLWYNVDARPAGGGDAGLNAAERAELVRHRCFVTSPRSGGDVWPYELSHTEEAG